MTCEEGTDLRVVVISGTEMDPQTLFGYAESLNKTVQKPYVVVDEPIFNDKKNKMVRDKWQGKIALGPMNPAPILGVIVYDGPTQCSKRWKKTDLMEAGENMTTLQLAEGKHCFTLFYGEKDEVYGNPGSKDAMLVGLDFTMDSRPWRKRFGAMRRAEDIWRVNG